MEYQSTSFDDKHTFFNGKEKFKDTIYNAFGNGKDSLVFKINPSIVQEIKYGTLPLGMTYLSGF